jgi:hypothetical protein
LGLLGGILINGITLRQTTKKQLLLSGDLLKKISDGFTSTSASLFSDRMNLFEVKRFHSIGGIAVFKTAGMKCIICTRMTGFKSDRAGREQMAFGGQANVR